MKQIINIVFFKKIIIKSYFACTGNALIGFVSPLGVLRFQLSDPESTNTAG